MGREIQGSRIPSSYLALATALSYPLKSQQSGEAGIGRGGGERYGGDAQPCSGRNTKLGPRAKPILLSHISFPGKGYSQQETSL